jgi:hypothetical protein
MIARSCPGRGAAFFMPLRRTWTVPNTGVRDGPGSAAHHAAKGRRAALRPGHEAWSNFLTGNSGCIAFLR